jgi:hypothetical protein
MEQDGKALKSVHALIVAILLPQKQVFLRFYPFLCVTMIQAGKWLFSEGKWPSQR